MCSAGAAALRVRLLRLLIELDRCGVELVRLLHQVIHGLASL